MIARFGMVLALALAFSAIEAEKAKAQCGIQGAYGYGFDTGRLYGVLAQNVPYFAAFPPVYYSAPVPRTYGYSPFAYPPGTRTPDLPTPEVAAKEIVNPYFRASTELEPAAGETQDADKVTQSDAAASDATAPMVVMNPYVRSPIAGSVFQGRVFQAPVFQAVVLNQ